MFKNQPKTPGINQTERISNARASTANETQAVSNSARNHLMSEKDWKVEDDMTFRRTGLSVGVVAGTVNTLAFGFEPYTIATADHRYKI